MTETKRVHPFRWLPTLYYYQALPFFLVTSAAGVLYKQYGVSNAWLAFATSVFYFPWVIKPFAGPFVEARGTLRRWIVVTQAATALTVAFVALASLHASFLWIASGLFLTVALLGMFQDIAAEGLYLHALTPLEQSWCVGWRATFFRLGWLTMQGGVVAWVGWMIERGVALDASWRIALGTSAGLFAVLSVLHFFVLPKDPPSTGSIAGSTRPLPSANYRKILFSFFHQPNVFITVSFLLLFRIGESQLQKLAAPFFLDPLEKGGLALSAKEVGLLYGTLGPLFLSLGGLLGGFLIAKHGLKKWIVPMTVAMNVPHALYVWLAFVQPQDRVWITAAINAEQFFYGFAFTAYLLFMIESSKRGPYPTAAYAVGSGLMAVGMMVPGSWSGLLQQVLGYPSFFLWAFACSVPSILASVWARRVL